VVLAERELERRRGWAVSPFEQSEDERDYSDHRSDHTLMMPTKETMMTPRRSLTAATEDNSTTSDRMWGLI
jgi:hypothetical protein